MSGPRPMRPRGDVELVGLGPEHAEAMYRWMCDPAVAENLGLRREPSPERTRAWIAAASEDEGTRPWAVLLGGTHVGNVVLDRIDTYLGTARMSVYVGEPEARGQGVGTSAVFLALRDGFEELGLHKVYLTVHARNGPAIAAYVRLGFQVEGVLRDEFRLGGSRVPALYMGLLRGEFEGGDRA